MTGAEHRARAVACVDAFCAGAIDQLASLLAPHCTVEGPLHRFANREEYLAALREDPPAPLAHRVLSVTHDGDDVAILYDIEKPDGTLRVAQWFRFGADGVEDIKIVFDARGFPSGDGR